MKFIRVYSHMCERNFKQNITDNLYSCEIVWYLSGKLLSKYVDRRRATFVKGKRTEKDKSKKEERQKLSVKMSVYIGLDFRFIWERK